MAVLGIIMGKHSFSNTWESKFSPSFH